MRKKLSTSFKSKLLLLFLLISAVPLIVAVSLNAMNMISDARKNIESEGTLRNRLAQEKISELYEKNVDVLRVLAASPVIKQYITSPPKQNDTKAEDLLIDANNIFNDGNHIVVTNKQGQQLLRTDGLKLVNVFQRWYFMEAMSGKESMSGVITSMASGRAICVVEVPILDNDEKIIGMIQRNYDLLGLQMFVNSLASKHTRVVILDREGKLLAHSSRQVATEADRIDESNYEFVQRALEGESGYLNAVIEGEECFVSYSQNKLTGWAIITIQPGAYTQEKIYNGAFMAGACGFALLLVICFAAYFLADKIAQPIIDLSKTVLSVADRAPKNNLIALAGDELKQMATAFNHIQLSATALKKASELDPLTQLYNKKSMENFCRETLLALDEEISMALYIIDLDHFKQANDTKGHKFGDLILQEFAKQLKEIFPQESLIGRFGGDEFVAFIPTVPNKDFISYTAIKVLEMARNLKINDASAEITASVGISVAPQDGIEYADLFEIADKSLYEVKRKGRDGYCLDTSTVIYN